MVHGLVTTSILARDDMCKAAPPDFLLLSAAYNTLEELQGTQVQCELHCVSLSRHSLYIL